MKRGDAFTCVVVLLLGALIAAVPGTASAQFNSGSSGNNGVFPPAPAGGSVPTTHSWIVWNMRTGKVAYCGTYTTNTGLDVCDPNSSPNVEAQIPMPPSNGVYEFTSFTLTTDVGYHRGLVVVGTSPNVPLTILSQTDIFMAGLPQGYQVTFYVRGWDGRSPSGNSLQLAVAGGLPGPSGFPGGASGSGGTTPGDGSPGFGPAGGAVGFVSNASADFSGQSATATALNPSLSPLTGGSGGGGGAGNSSTAPSGCGANNYAGGAGGGGGGALLLSASGKVTIGSNATIQAQGGQGASTGNSCGFGGGGSGGNVRVVASEITGTGTIQVQGGVRGNGGNPAAGGAVRFESSANTFTGAIQGAVGGSFVSFPTAPLPANQPQLKIVSINAQAAPATPSSSLSNPDITFATAVIGAVPLALSATNVPSGTLINIKVTPAFGSATTATATLDNAGTAQASVVLPPGAGIVTATASFNAPQAMLNIKFDGDLARRTEVVTQPDGTSKTFVIASSGARFEIGARQ